MINLPYVCPHYGFSALLPDTCIKNYQVANGPKAKNKFGSGQNPFIFTGEKCVKCKQGRKLAKSIGLRLTSAESLAQVE